MLSAASNALSAAAISGSSIVSGGRNRTTLPYWPPVSTISPCCRQAC
ncbi:Uncharacterised protein [Mycobacteroides abscessus subsp. abscessus]|nr:Uncharacterised protein [Mycobacteroides abscessus subsp. abscessus]